MAVAVDFYKSFMQDLGLGRFNLSTDAFKIILVSGYTFDINDEDLSYVSGELSTGSGYTNGGAVIPNVDWSWNEDNGFVRLDADDVTWIAAGGDIGPITGAIIYNDTITSPTADRLVCYIDFGTEETISDESNFTVTFGTDGLFSFTQT